MFTNLPIVQEEVGVGPRSVEDEDLFTRLEVAQSEALPTVQLFVEVRCYLTTIIFSQNAIGISRRINYSWARRVEHSTMYVYLGGNLKRNVDPDHVFEWKPRISKGRIGHLQAMWSEVLRSVTGNSWMREAEDRTRWRANGVSYVQQSTPVG